GVSGAPLHQRAPRPLRARTPVADRRAGRAHPRYRAAERAADHRRRLQRLAAQGESHPVRGARRGGSLPGSHRPAGAYVSFGDADVPARSHLRARAAGERGARALCMARIADVRSRRAGGDLRARSQPSIVARMRAIVARFTPGNRIGLLRSGREYFPALVSAIETAKREVWLECYIFADDAAGRTVADALVRAAQRGVAVRVLVDGWGARHYLTPPLESMLRDGGVDLMRYRPDIAPWDFHSNRLRRLHRKLCHVDRRIAFVGGINVIDDLHTP